MLSFKHEVFLEVVRQLSYTKASQILYISQPAVTKHIQQLEANYKTSLFDRKGNSISLTEVGKILYDYLLQAKNLEKQLDFEISTHFNNTDARGELRLGASTTVALYIIPPVLSGFRKSFPSVQLSLLNRNSENILTALLNHEIDLGIIEGKKKMPRVKSEHFLTDEVVPVCSSKSDLTKKSSITLKELKETAVALRERGSGTLTALKSALASKSIKLTDLNVVMQLGGTEALKNFILADECIGFLPMRSITKELAAGELVRLFIDDLSIIRHFYFVHRQGEEQRGLHKMFVRYAKTHYNVKL
ncbi:MAG: LysR family transcriptional regulator [Flammeovirgaceae bacterium]|nr:LysR family transcriptional regulator [Flammeovirgaceae bacterium]